MVVLMELEIYISNSIVVLNAQYYIIILHYMNQKL